MKINEVIKGPLAFNEKLDQKVISVIRQQCSPYLTEVGGLINAISVHPLWRGVPNFSWADQPLPIINISVNQQREPRDMSKKTHDSLNVWFKKTSGIAFRSQSIFCTGNIQTAHKYSTNFGSEPGGDEVIVLPVGDYKYCWSPLVEDLYRYISDRIYRWNRTELKNREQILKLLNDSDYIFNTGLNDAISSGNEIMIHCQSAIILNKTYREYLITKYKS